MKVNKGYTVDDLLRGLHAAQAEFDAAHRAYLDAKEKRQAALKSLSAEQECIDKWFSGVCDDAPLGSRWHRTL